MMLIVSQGQDMSRLIGGLVTTIQEFSRQNAGMPVAYIEFEMRACAAVPGAMCEREAAGVDAAGGGGRWMQCGCGGGSPGVTPVQWL